jgi:ABC-type bacteriocin/lantibiotic exporter with double-glycine peptidase domain
VPFVAQQRDTCAAAALAMLTAYWGHPVSHDVAASALLQPELQGILGSRLADFARAHGFEALAYRGDLEHLRAFVSKGRPLIVAWGLAGGRFHDVVVVGFDDVQGVVLVNDPAVGSARSVPREEFEQRWAAAGHWTLLVLPRAP